MTDKPEQSSKEHHSNTSETELDIRATSLVQQPRQRRRRVDPTQDTNVLSSDDRRLKRLLDAQPDENNATMSLGDKQEVILLIRGMVERVVMEVGKIYKLGRFEIGAAADDEIDMTPYGAQDRGVSRVHAELQILEGVVHIKDLGSTNGTFINSKRLESDVATPLRKGDELLLGRLAMQVLFR